MSTPTADSIIQMEEALLTARIDYIKEKGWVRHPAVRQNKQRYWTKTIDEEKFVLKLKGAVNFQIVLDRTAKPTPPTP